jgi:hypothetical protein
MVLPEQLEILELLVTQDLLVNQDLQVQLVTVEYLV